MLLWPKGCRLRLPACSYRRYDLASVQTQPTVHFYYETRNQQKFMNVFHTSEAITWYNKKQNRKNVL